MSTTTEKKIIALLVKAFGRERVIAELIQTAGPEKFLACHSGEEILLILRKDDIAAALCEQAILAVLGKEKILRQMLAELGPEELQKMIAKISRN